MDETLWRELLDRYGQEVALRRGGEETVVKAFFQPVRELDVGEVPTPLGGAPRGKYLYLGDPGEDLEDVESLWWQGRGYRFLRVRPKFVGEQIAYWWGVAEETDRGVDA